MFDSLFLLIVVVVVGVVTDIPVSGALIILFLLWLAISIIPFVVRLLKEEVCRYFGGEKLVAVIELRHSRGAIIRRPREKAVRETTLAFDLTFDPTAPGEKEKLQELHQTILRANAEYPSGIVTGMTTPEATALMARLAGRKLGDSPYEVLVKHAIEAVENLRETAPKKGVLNAFLGRITFPFALSWLCEIHQDVGFGAYFLNMKDVPEDHLIRNDLIRYYNPDLVLKHACQDNLWRAGFPSKPLPPGESHLKRIPLHGQRRLIAMGRALYGPTWRYLLTILLNPLSFRTLLRCRWAYRQQAAATERERRSAMAQRANTAELQVLENDPAKIDALLAGHREKTILLLRSWPIDSGIDSASWLGGRPRLPENYDWPRRARSGIPRHFLAQIDFASLPDLGGQSPLPRDGMLLVFADIDDEMEWSNDEEPGDEPTSVIYIPAAEVTETERDEPDDTPDIHHTPWSLTGDYALRDQKRYLKWPLRPKAFDTYSSTDSLPVALRQSSKIDDRRNELKERALKDLMPTPEWSEHAMLGPTQDKTNPTEANGVRLLMLDSDSAVDFNFCGGGVIEFWIDEDDLSNCNFDNVIALTNGD